MNYTIEYNNYGSSYVVKMEGDRYIMVNIASGTILEQELPILLQFGMWIEQPKPPSEDICRKIDDTLKANGI